MSESKYTTQIKNLRKNYVRFPLDFKPEELDLFKKLCSHLGTTPTTEIKRFVREFCEKHQSEGI